VNHTASSEEAILVVEYNELESTVAVVDGSSSGEVVVGKERVSTSDDVGVKGRGIRGRSRARRGRALCGSSFASHRFIDAKLEYPLVFSYRSYSNP
jgi:hypothetical protein